jgi:hypothetical protein
MLILFQDAAGLTCGNPKQAPQSNPSDPSNISSDASLSLGEVELFFIMIYIVIYCPFPI